MLTQGEHANSNPERCRCEVTSFISRSCFSFRTAAKETTTSWIGKKPLITRIGDKQTKALDQGGRRYLKTHQPPHQRGRGSTHALTLMGIPPQLTCQTHQVFQAGHAGSKQLLTWQQLSGSTSEEDFRRQSKLSTKNYTYSTTLQTKDSDCLSAYQRWKRRVLSEGGTTGALWLCSHSIQLPLIRVN